MIRTSNPTLRQVELTEWMALVISLGLDKKNFLCLALRGHRVLEEKHVKYKVKKRERIRTKLDNLFSQQTAESLSHFRNPKMQMQVFEELMI